LRGDLNVLTTTGSGCRLFVLERATEAVGARRAPSINDKPEFAGFLSSGHGEHEGSPNFVIFVPGRSGPTFRFRATALRRDK